MWSVLGRQVCRFLAPARSKVASVGSCCRPSGQRSPREVENGALGGGVPCRLRQGVSQKARREVRPRLILPFGLRVGLSKVTATILSALATVAARPGLGQRVLATQSRTNRRGYGCPRPSCWYRRRSLPSAKKPPFRRASHSEKKRSWPRGPH